VLAAEPAVAGALSSEELAAALDPARHLGQAAALIDRALAIHQKGRRTE
jgi:adenylosuccinate lyase